MLHSRRSLLSLFAVSCISVFGDDNNPSDLLAEQAELITLNVAGGKLSLDDTTFGWMKESNDILDDAEALNERLAQDGYLFIRGLLPEEVVVAAFETVANVLIEQGIGSHIENQTDLVASDAVMSLLSKDSTEKDNSGILKPSGGWKVNAMELMHEEAISRMLAAKELYAFYEKLFGEEAATFDYKWMRPVPPGEFTGFHVDNVYMNKGSDKLHTTWMPLMNVDFELGGLAVLEGSNSLPEFNRHRDTYGEYDMDTGDVRGFGWLTSEPKELLKHGGKMVTTRFRPGDAVVFTMHTFHGSLMNMSDRRLRLSTDVRFQPASHPRDPRWMKPDPGHRRFTPEKRHDPKYFPRSMEAAKCEWGLSPSLDICNAEAAATHTEL